MRTVLLLWLSLAIILPAQEVDAQKRVKGQYATSQLPASRVGDLNAELSSLCRQGLFKQIRVLSYSIGFVGDRGRGITGIAHKGWNLYDPLGKAEDRRTYHFQSQGYSDCRVYVAVTPARNEAPIAPR